MAEALHASSRTIRRYPPGGLREPRSRARDACAPPSPPGRPIIGAGAGTGLSAKSAEAGGVDLIIIYNSGRYRMAGRGSLAGLLAYGDANRSSSRWPRGAAGRRDTPVLAGCAAPTRSGSWTGSSTSWPPWDSPASRTSRPSVCTTGCSGRTSRRPEWATTWRSRWSAGRERDLLTAPYVFDAGQARHGRGGRRRPGPARGADHQRHHRRHHRPHPRRSVRKRAGHARRRRGGATPTSSCSATAGRSPNPRTPRTFWPTRTASPASSAPRRSSGCPPNAPSPSRSSVQDDAELRRHGARKETHET